MDINKLKLYKSFEYILDKYSRRRSKHKLDYLTGDEMTMDRVHEAVTKSGPTYNVRFNDLFKELNNETNELLDIVSGNLNKYSHLLYEDKELRERMLNELVQPLSSKITNKVHLNIRAWNKTQKNEEMLAGIISVIMICFLKETKSSPELVFSKASDGEVLLKVLDKISSEDQEIEEILFEGWLE